MLVTQQEQLRTDVTALVDKLGPDRSSLIPILQDCQEPLPRRRHGRDADRRGPARHPPGRGLQRRHVLRVPEPRAPGRVRRPPVRHDLVRAGRQGRRRPGARERARHRLRRDHGRRPLHARLGGLHGHVRPGPGPARQRQGLHARHARDGARDRRPSAVPPTAGTRPSAQRGTSYEHRDSGQRPHLRVPSSADAGLKAALALSRPDIIDMVTALPHQGPRRRRLPDRHEVELRGRREGASPSTSSATPTRANPGPSRTGSSSPTTPDLVLRGHDDRRPRHRRQRGHRLPARRVHVPALAPQQRSSRSARDAGLLGKDVGGVEGFDFDIIVALGAGAYICGEETALIESLEGFRGEPRNRPPFPVVSGFLGVRRVVNNVETLAWAACIIAKGVDWFTEHRHREVAPATSCSASPATAPSPGVYEFPLGHHRRPAAQGGRRRGRQGRADRRRLRARCVPAREFGRASSPSRTSPPAARSS